MLLAKCCYLLLYLQLAASDLCATSSWNNSKLIPPKERMLSRKKRFMIFPKGTSVKFTFQLTKRLLAEFPRGFNYVIEAATYYPMPGSRLDLIPKRLRKPTTTTPKPIGTKPPLFICIPGSLICYKGKPATKPPKVQRIDADTGKLQWIESQQQGSQFQKYQNYAAKYQSNDGEKYQDYGQNYHTQSQHYASPQQWSQWAKYGQPQQYEKYKWTPAQPRQQNYQWKPAVNSVTGATQRRHWRPYDAPAHTKWSQPRFQQYHTQHRQQRWRRALSRVHVYLPEYGRDPLDSIYEYKQMHFSDLEPHYEWRHYHSHRDRRQLFHQFEGLTATLGFDMKACIVRAICESKRYLLPPGYSMIQDILRLVFTLPTINGLEDDYSRAMHADYETCDRFLKPKCPFNILKWFLNTEKSL